MSDNTLNRKTFTADLNGDAVTLEVSDLAKQANAAVIGKHGETVVLATVVMENEPSDRPFFPLTVDYEERFYAAGKILGSRFVRREGRPSDEAVLSARLIDRAIRPLFDQRMRNPIQVVVTVLAYDETHDPDAVAMLAVSTALAISDIPWDGPVAGVSAADGNAFFAGIKGKINMIEFEGKEASEEEVVQLFEDASSQIDTLVAFQEKIVKEIGKEKREISFPEIDQALTDRIADVLDAGLDEALANKTVDDLEKNLVTELKDEEVDSDTIAAARYLFDKEVERRVIDKAVSKKERVDGRALDEVRPLYAEVGLFERTHGSGLFIRGNTQLLAITTLAPPSAEQLIETMEMTGGRRFMLHYNFPNYSVGEIGRMGGPGRREIGHGTLAKKALNAMIPSSDEFPYTIRVVAETLSSNGSSSMATVCSTTLSLMDAGVPIAAPVAGIAMGLMRNPNGDHVVLTDIQGPEDHYGDMDLKVAGTKDGINAIQMDVKIEGITADIFKQALPQAKQARLHILDTMLKALAAPRPELSPYAPSILTITIDPLRIGEVIGPGGKMINGIIEQAGEGTNIDIDDDGTVFISSPKREYAEKALELVQNVVRTYEPGDMVVGTVAKILDFGAIVELGGGHSGMIHVSELSDEYVEKVTDVVKEGQTVRAKVIKVEHGKMGLSLKGVDQSGI